MENMDNSLTVPKWVLRNWPKIPKMPQNLSAQFLCSSPKVGDFDEKRLHWAFAVRLQNKTFKTGFLREKNCSVNFRSLKQCPRGQYSKFLLDVKFSLLNRNKVSFILFQTYITNSKLNLPQT